MPEPFLAEIRAFGFRFPPTGWALCDGQLLPISQNSALFALLGTVYGGDGKSTFGLPNLQGKVPLQQGHGSGLSNYILGQASGTTTATLTALEMAAHQHGVMALNGFPANLAAPDPSAGLSKSSQGNPWSPPANLQVMAGQLVATTGDSGPHNNMMPYLTVNFCIALQGVFPQRP